MPRGRPIQIKADADALYAIKGEMVYCDNGHEVGRITRDLKFGELARGDEVEDFDLNACRKCWCGAYVTRNKWDGSTGFIFAEGIRMGPKPTWPITKKRINGG